MPAFDRIVVIDATIPALTPIASALVIPLAFTPGIVKGGSFLIPSGCVGLVGFYLGYGPNNLVPDNPGGFIRGNGEVWQFAVRGLPSGDQYNLTGYNLDKYDHTIQVRLNVDEIPLPVPQPTIPLALNSTEAPETDAEADAEDAATEATEAAELAADQEAEA